MNFLFLSSHNALLMPWLGPGTKTTWLGVRKTTWPGLKYLFWSPHSQIQMVQLPVKNRWFSSPLRQLEMSTGALKKHPRLTWYKQTGTFLDLFHLFFVHTCIHEVYEICEYLVMIRSHTYIKWLLLPFICNIYNVPTSKVYILHLGKRRAGHHWRD